MKNYFKKFSVMFIIAFAIMFGNFTNAFAVSHVLSVSYATTVRINDTTISFDKVIYVDPQNGDDITGLGNEKYPYSTIKRALEVCSAKGSAIFLKGTTKETTNPINLASKSVTIIGDYLKYGSKITSSINNGSINIYNVYLPNSSTATYGEIFASIASLNLYNCIFEENSYYTNVSVTSSNFYNCLIIKQGIKYNSTINYVNCAFKAKIATNDTCVSNVTYDDKFKLTSDSGRWQNAGTGKNPDGTLANMGLYGGKFAWGTWTGNKESILLNKSTMTLTEDASEQLTATTTPAGVGVTWKSSNESIATVDSNGKVTAIKEGQATITATTADGNNLSATCTVTVTAKPIVVPPTQQTTSSAVVLNIEPEKPQIHLKERISADLVIDNITEIAAEDVRIKYDNTKLKFLGVNEIDGIKLVKPVYKDGELRFILASKGTANIANAKKVLLTLKFQGIASGDALVDITKGKVSDGITMEKDLTDAECSQATIKIDDTVLKDVNNTGEFTLLDLAIDARHLGEDPTTLTQYNTDQVIDGEIDNDDLLKIGEYMLANPNYKLVNIQYDK